MAEFCEAHKDMMKRVEDQSTAIEGKISRASLKWVAAVFAVPAIGAILLAWGFMASADYKYGSILQAQQNAAKIGFLEEKTVQLRTDLIKAQTDIMDVLKEIKQDLRYMRARAIGDTQ